MNEIPKWQQDLVIGRIEKARSHPERMLNWDEVAKILGTGQIKPKSNIKELNAKCINFNCRKSGQA